MIALANFFAAQKPAAPRVTSRIRARVDDRAARWPKPCSARCATWAIQGTERDPARGRPVWPQYVSKQLHAFKAKTRTNDAGNMTSVSVTLSDDDIENLANYIGTLD